MSSVPEPAPDTSVEPAIEVLQSNARRYERHRNRQDWLTFDPERPASARDGGFEILENIAESHWGPQATARSVEPQAPIEVVTYVRAGRLVRTDSSGARRELHAGEFEREAIAAGGSQYVEANPSGTHFAHLFRISLRLDRPHLERTHECKRFSEAERKGRMFVVASPGGENGSLRLVQDVRIVSSLLYPGRHVAHELHPRRAAWVHVVHGAVSLGPLVLRKGDGAGVTAGAVSVTAREHSEILLIDMPTASIG
jgi:hypothetical protein